MHCQIQLWVLIRGFDESEAGPDLAGGMPPLAADDPRPAVKFEPDPLQCRLRSQH